MTEEGIGKRLKLLIGKLLSYKNFVFVVSCAMCAAKCIPWQAWLSVTVAVIGCNSGMKALHIRNDGNKDGIKEEG